MRKFDTKVQKLKYQVLKQIAKHSFNNDLLKKLVNIPKIISPGPKATMRCCIYKERAILNERIKIAMGGNQKNSNVIEVIDIACDECPVSGYEVSEACRGCIAHRCEDVCKKGAIIYGRHQKAYIDQSKCVECGLCAKVCPFSAILHNRRPCEKSCKVKAISMNEQKTAQIDDEKCIACGACVYQCPFGAIVDKSFILDVIKIIQESEKNTNYNVYAVVAPSVSSQFRYAKPGQVISGISNLGFFKVVEAALGADMVAFNEAKELAEKGFLLSSCCSSFVDYVKKQFPDMVEHLSHNLSPMATIAKYIKETDPGSKVIFIGPCTSKKMEIQTETVKPYIDSAITFEELQALFDGKGIDITKLEESVLDNASYYGRIFARSGGLAEAVSQGLKEHNITDFEFKPICCNGIEECKKALLQASKNIHEFNFIEGMACVGGCIGGAGCLTHGEKNKNDVDKYGKASFKKDISDAINLLDI